MDERFNSLLLTPSTERWIRARLPLLVLAVLLCLGAANVASRATWREVEDGVLWIEQNGVVAAEIAPERRRSASDCDAATFWSPSTTFPFST